jgi:hypothetical protein
MASEAHPALAVVPAGVIAGDTTLSTTEASHGYAGRAIPPSFQFSQNWSLERCMLLLNREGAVFYPRIPAALLLQMAKRL